MPTRFRLEVEEANDKAIGFYLSQGFAAGRPDGELRHRGFRTCRR